MQPELLVLTLMAPTTMEKALKSELSRSGSFLAKEASDSIRLIRLVEVIKTFSQNASFRPLNRQDLPGSQMQLVGDNPTLYLFDDQGLFLAKLLALKGIPVDPGAIHIHVLKAEKQWVYILSAYDSKAGLVRCKAVAWHDDKMTPITFYGLKPDAIGTPELTNKLPLGSTSQYIQEDGLVLLPIRKVGEASRSRLETAYLSHKTTRYELKYNPKKYYSYGYYYGGYDTISVPYTEAIPYEKSINYKETTTGNAWQLYAWDGELSTLRLKSSLWLPDGEDPIVKKGKIVVPTLPQVDKKPQLPQVHISNPSATNIESRNDDDSTPGDTIDRMSIEARSRSLSTEELSSLSKQELRLVRNAIFARSGYIFKSKDLQQYFAGKSWYRPQVSNMSAVYSALSRTEKGSVDKIRTME
jgi:hypothetical protein